MNNKNIILPVKGTRDFYPPDWAFQTWLYRQIKEVSESFGFEEYEGPIIESLDLYAAKSGEELVKKQAFTLKDQAGNTLALRPEMTPTLARMVAQKIGQLILPVKWFTYGRRFRYEKPQKGRGREFFQWDADILGPDSPQADAETIAVAVELLKKIGLTPEEVVIKINDRKLLEELLSSIYIPVEKIKAVFGLIDKVDKVSSDDFMQIGMEIGLKKDQVAGIVQIINEKENYLKSPWLLDVLKQLKNYGVSEYVVFDPKIVRGLDYYTGTVFEAWDIKGQFRAIWGGGRYDNLVEQTGSRQKVPGVGFAMGDMVLAELLKSNKKYPVLDFNPTRILVTVFNTDLFDKSLFLANKLRAEGINCEVYLMPEAKMDKQLKYADIKGIPFIVILGPDEIKNDTVTVKNLKTREQKTFGFTELLEVLK